MSNCVSVIDKNAAFVFIMFTVHLAVAIKHRICHAILRVCRKLFLIG